ncbi:MAG: acetyltransferase [Melioribacteraceae bacterium]|nr:acetyltransferase [Saprospiraceae bacterium]MCF8355752.1 acetyltransferase [Melioribacteraceae bacterium]MCF8394780.1 acetyltransferase [Melioribacteraceae bacterium]
MNDQIVVIGGGGHAKVIISILKKLNQYDIVGYTDPENKGEILGISYLGNDDSLNSLFKDDVYNAVIGLGQIKSAALRRKIVDICKRIGFNLPTIVSPNAIINEDVSIGSGTVVMDGVTINSGSSIGECSIVNTNASIDHDCSIGDFTHIAPGVTLSGEVNIGNDVLIGTGSNIIQQINIPDNTIISAGSTVLKSINKTGIYKGNPACLIKEI